MMTARSRGIPVCIYRLGMITGHSQTGVSQTDDMMCRMIKGFIQLGSAPDLDLMVDMTPVDYVRMPSSICRGRKNHWESFSLGQSSLLHLSKLVNEINALGYP